jgi:hypothetical protein
MKKAPRVIKAQQINRKREDCQNPVAALATGKASMPAPMEVPTIKRTPPMNLEFMLKPGSIEKSVGVDDGSKEWG